MDTSHPKLRGESEISQQMSKSTWRQGQGWPGADDGHPHNQPVHMLEKKLAIRTDSLFLQWVEVQPSFTEGELVSREGMKQLRPGASQRCRFDPVCLHCW